MPAKISRQRTQRLPFFRQQKYLLRSHRSRRTPRPRRPPQLPHRIHHRDISDGKYILCLQTKHQVDIGGPVPNTLYTRQLRPYLRFIETRQPHQIELFPNDRFGQCPQIFRLLPADLASPHFLIRQPQDILRRKGSHISIKLFKMRLRRLEAHLLLQYYLGQRNKTRLPRPARWCSILFIYPGKYLILPDEFLYILLINNSGLIQCTEIYKVKLITILALRK